MQVIKDSSLEEFRDSARALVGNLPIAVARERRGVPGVDRTRWQEIARAGWFSASVDEANGGLGLGYGVLVAILQEAGAALVPEPVIGAALHPLAVLEACPASALRDSLIAKIQSGELLVAVAWQHVAGELEPTWVARPKYAAFAERGETFVHVAAPAEVDGWLVLRHTSDGTPSLVWFERERTDVSVESVPCVDGTTSTQIKLSACNISEDAILVRGSAAKQAVVRGNDLARIAVAADLLGVARQAIELTLKHLGDRKQFGKPLSSFQALRHRMVDAWVQQELAGACLLQVAGRLDSDNVGDQELATLASRAKARCAHAALVATRTGIQMHGAMGYTDEADIGLYFKRALRESAWLGNAGRHRLRHHELIADKTEVGDASERDADQFPRAADWNAMPEVEFRHLVRSFFRKHYPPEMRNIPRRVHWHEIKEWYMTLSRQGWVAPGWPQEHGGMGLSPGHLLAFVDEQEKHGVARAPDMGIVMIGPLLIQRGTALQQQTWLPRILAGEHVWCQGYSEPGAGSDLASLRTEAVHDGDHYVVNGQKIWTTLAQDATHMFALVRTDKSVKKQAGISFLLIDLATSGVTVRPIKDLGGDHEFCEVFFDNVKVPAVNLVGEPNEGWTIAKALLGFERIFLGSPKQSRFALGQLRALAVERNLFDEQDFSARYAELEMDVEDLAAAYTFFAEIVKRGEALPASVSLLKLWATDTYQRITGCIVDSADEHGGTSSTADFGERRNHPALLISSLPSTIYGGSAEIQREILAKSVLNMQE